MNKKIIVIILVFAALVLGGYLQYKKNKSQESSMPQISFEEKIVIEDPYAFATVPNAKTAAAFMWIANTQEQGDKLIGVKSDIAEFTEIHENYIDPDDGIMMMRKISGIKIPKKDTVTLKPKGYHVMFINLNTTLKIDDSFPLTLVFENAEEQIIHVNVVPAGTTPRKHH